MNSARKIKLRVPQPPPRNPLVAPTAQRKAGRHGKTRAAERRAQKVELGRQLRNLDA